MFVDRPINDTDDLDADELDNIDVNEIEKKIGNDSDDYVPIERNRRVGTDPYYNPLSYNN